MNRKKQVRWCVCPALPAACGGFQGWTCICSICTAFCRRRLCSHTPCLRAASLSLPMDGRTVCCCCMFPHVSMSRKAEPCRAEAAAHCSPPFPRTCIVNKKTKRSLTLSTGNDWVGANTRAYQPVTGVADRRRTSSREKTRGAFPALRQAMLEVIYVTRHGVSFSTHPRGSVAASCFVSGPGEATPGVGCSRDPHASIGSHHPAAEAIHMYLGMDGRQGRFRVLLFS